ncbi:MAG: hypothetical protein ACQETA_08460 [Bacteroidota bacterium]
MKTKYIIRSVILGFFLGSLLLTACSKEDEPLFETAFDGLLEVEYINTYPPWTVSTSMAFTMTENGEITIATGTLSYSGELTMEDSKITRSGTWLLSPEGHFEESNSTIVINPNITVSNDVTKVYAKDNYGNWVKVSEAPYSGAAGGPVTFGLMLAVTSPAGSVQTVSDGTGSITWTLGLFEANNPIVP